MKIDDTVTKEFWYEEVISFFGTAKLVAEHYGISVQSVYQWRTEGVPETRLRELKLLKKLRGV